MTMRLVMLCGALLAVSAQHSAGGEPRQTGDTGEDWPRWRGPHGNGTWNAPKLPEKWPDDGLKRLWSRPIGGGYAGVIVADGRVYTCDRQTEPREVERVLCFDSETGKPLWSHAYPVEYGKLDYGSGPRAAPTVHGGRVYSLGAVGHLFCLDAVTGKPIWSVHLIDDLHGRQPTWGYAASPVIYENLVIVQPGGESGRSIAALDRETGKRVWSSLSDEAAYATPILIQHGGAEQLICWTPSHVRSLDPRTGRPHWAIPYKVTYGVSIATPIFHRGIVFVSGYWEGSRAVRLGENPTDATLAWEENRFLRGVMSQSLYRDGYVYLLDKRYGLTCFEIETGRKLWDDENQLTPRERNPQATLVWLNDGERIIALNARGELVLARLNPEGYREQSRTKIIGETWAHPAYAGSRVFARSDTELVSVELPVRRRAGRSEGNSPPRSR